MMSYRTHDWHTDAQTDAGNDYTWMPKQASGNKNGM